MFRCSVDILSCHLSQKWTSNALLDTRYSIFNFTDWTYANISTSSWAWALIQPHNSTFKLWKLSVNVFNSSIQQMLLSCTSLSFPSLWRTPSVLYRSRLRIWVHSNSKQFYLNPIQDSSIGQERSPHEISPTMMQSTRNWCLKHMILSLSKLTCLGNHQKWSNWRCKEEKELIGKNHISAFPKYQYIAHIDMPLQITKHMCSSRARKAFYGNVELLTFCLQSFNAWNSCCTSFLSVSHLK